MSSQPGAFINELIDCNSECFVRFSGFVHIF
jgi:hypothetical protein